MNTYNSANTIGFLFLVHYWISISLYQHTLLITKLHSESLFGLRLQATIVSNKRLSKRNWSFGHWLTMFLWTIFKQRLGLQLLLASAVSNKLNICKREREKRNTFPTPHLVNISAVTLPTPPTPTTATVKVLISS